MKFGLLAQSFLLALIIPAYQSADLKKQNLDKQAKSDYFPSQQLLQLLWWREEKVSDKAERVTHSSSGCGALTVVLELVAGVATAEEVGTGVGPTGTAEAAMHFFLDLVVLPVAVAAAVVARVTLRKQTNKSDVTKCDVM